MTTEKNIRENQQNSSSIKTFDTPYSAVIARDIRNNYGDK